MEETIVQALQRGTEINEKLKKKASEIARAARIIIDCIKADKKLLICGNGGSAADSQHIAAELVGRFKRERRALPALALTTDSSILTSIANDYSFDEVFARQVEAQGLPGDILLAISTSGNSANVVKAVCLARKTGLKTIALSGCDGGQLAREADLSIVVPSDDTAMIQQGQAAIYHILCDLVEEAFVSEARGQKSEDRGQKIEAREEKS